MTCRVVVRLLPMLGQNVCERATQPIGLVHPDLIQDRLAKLTEHPTHVNMMIGAIAQHDLWVARSEATESCLWGIHWISHTVSSLQNENSDCGWRSYFSDLAFRFTSWPCARL